MRATWSGSIYNCAKWRTSAGVQCYTAKFQRTSQSLKPFAVRLFSKFRVNGVCLVSNFQTPEEEELRADQRQNLEAEGLWIRSKKLELNL